MKMQLSEYISHLQKLLETAGDLEVKTHTGDGGCNSPQKPAVAFMRIPKGREYKITFWNSWEGEDRKGVQVIKV